MFQTAVCPLAAAHYSFQIPVLCDVSPWSGVNRYRCFERTHCIHLQGKSNRRRMWKSLPLLKYAWQKYTELFRGIPTWISNVNLWAKSVKTLNKSPAGGTYEDNEFLISFITSTSTASFYFKDLNEVPYGQLVNYIQTCIHT